MYIVGGFNVYPAEIEKQMSSLPGLYRCAIVGVPDFRLGAIGHAFVVRAAGSSLTEAEILAWSKAKLANYKIPRGIHLCRRSATQRHGQSREIRAQGHARVRAVIRCS